MTLDDLASRVDHLEQLQAAPNASTGLTAEEIAKSRQAIADLIAEAQAAQRRADDEALRASSAKQACEDHAKAIAATRGQVEVDVTAIGAIKTRCEEVERAMNASRSVGEDAVRAITTSQEALQKAQNWVSQNLPTVEGNAQAIASAKASSDTLLQDTAKSTADAKQAMSETARSKDQASQILEEAKKVRAELELHATKIHEAKTAAEADRASSEKKVEELIAITTDLQKRHEEIIAHREELRLLVQENRKLNEKAEGLLPHAASAGLASAFRQQKERFKWPQRGWLAAFVFSVVVLFAISIPDYWAEIMSAPTITDSKLNWEYLLRHFIHRLPLVVPLVWLAIYAGRNFTMSIRMEEDYAYKEAVSTAFEGYKREMATIPNPAGAVPIPLLTLCDNVLNAVAQRPGRIYEGEHQDVTPLTPAVNAAKNLLPGAQRTQQS